MRPTASLMCVLVVAAGCDSGDPDGQDGGDGGVDADASPPSPAEPPASVVMTPCPRGWREVAGDGIGSPVTCDPWPSEGRQGCDAGEAHFPGGARCERVGSPCPTVGDYSPELPTDVTVHHVRSGADEGGDGTESAPYSSVAGALDAAGDGEVIALAVGTYDETVRLPRGVTLWGACVAETTLTWSTSHETGGTVTVVGEGTAVRNLTLSGEGPALFAGDPWAEVHLQDVVIDGARDAAIVAGGGAAVTAESLVIHGTRPTAEGQYGRGIQAELGAQVRLAHAVLEGNHEVSAVAMNAGTLMVLSDTAVLSTEIPPAGTLGWGVAVFEGARVELSRVTVEGSAAAGLEAAREGSSLSLDHVVVRDTRVATSSSGAELGTGIVIESGASLEGARVLVEEASLVGVGPLGAGSRASFEDLVVRRMAGHPRTTELGHCVVAVVDSELEITRAFLQGCREVGIAAADGVVARLSDLVVRDTAADWEGRFGWGLGAGTGSLVELQRGRFEGNREASVVAFDEGTSVTLSDVEILETLERPCAADSCAGEAGGSGAVALEGASMDIRRFVIRGAALAGVQLARGGEVDLHEGEVSGCAVGANVQTEGFDLARLMDDVTYRDNGRDLDTEAMPLPEPALP